MSQVVFYEKPGCITNGKQKALLRSCGFELDVRNLLAESWTEARLLPFLEDLPVTDWFNRSAPQVKSGEIDPAAEDNASALALLLENPLLIRRPLLDTEFGKAAGFDNRAVLTALGVQVSDSCLIDGCSKPRDRTPCPEPGQ